MPRERHRFRTRSPAMPGGVMLRLSSAIMALLILGMIFTRARDPRTWRWLAPEDDAALVAAIPAQAGPATAAPTETVVEGPTDLDEADSRDVLTQFAAVGDKSEIAPEDMPAYWRLMKWARAQTFEELQARAAQKVPYTQFFDQPEQHRGKPVRLRLHIKRIVSYAAPENSAGVETVYEVWGTTDESLTYFYSVLCSELPPGMQPGTDISAEGVFVGYFLKVMPYQGAIKRLAAPLLIGRLRNVPRAAAPPAPELPGWVWMTGGVVLLAAAAWGWKQFAHAPPRRKVQTAGVGDEAAEWFGDSAASDSPTTQNEQNPPPAE